MTEDDTFKELQRISWTEMDKKRKDWFLTRRKNRNMSIEESNKQYRELYLRNGWTSTDFIRGIIKYGPG